MTEFETEALRLLRSIDENLKAVKEIVLSETAQRDAQDAVLAAQTAMPPAFAAAIDAVQGNQRK